MIEYGIDKPFMITFLWRQRNKCGTKEDYETAHDSPYHINTPWGAYGTDKNKNSIGDHLENFIADLKTNKFCFENAGLGSMDTNSCFHFAMGKCKINSQIRTICRFFIGFCGLC